MRLSRCPAVIMMDVFVVRTRPGRLSPHTSTYRLFGSFVQLWEILCGFVLIVWTYCRRGYVRRLLYCRIGLLYFSYTPYDVTGTSFPRDLLLALLEVLKGPWSPLGCRGERAMAMVAGLHASAVHQMLSLPVVGCLFTLKGATPRRGGQLPRGESNFKRKSWAGTHWLNATERSEQTHAQRVAPFQEPVGTDPKTRLSGVPLLLNSAGIFVLFSAVGGGMSEIVVLPGRRLNGVGGPG